VVDAERCVRCGCAEHVHDPLLGYCLDPECHCLQFVSEADELEAGLARGEYPEELNFDDDAA
jgi:hypothetical protein